MQDKDDLQLDNYFTGIDDSVALLRAETRVKLPWVLERIQRELGDLDVNLLDVGCGGGFLSNGLSVTGLDVTGLDISAESLDVAQRWDATGRVRYINGDAYHLPFHDESFDCVTAMDFLEHVDDPDIVIRECVRVLRPGGLFFFQTFNRNYLAGYLAVKMVELLVRNNPKSLNMLRLFIKPNELAQLCEENNLEVQEIVGLRPKFSSIPLKCYWSGFVPPSVEFQLTKSTLLSYMGYATKRER
ncbi:MAG: bifunctional 2-polyprenyl-6-hydroxyphenol methylase/3-demethylubiquinol 3-O-methyltransferase UbiG [Bdellovibrionota bacterium]